MTVPFIVVVKSTTDARVYTGRGFSKHGKNAHVFERGDDAYARIDAVNIASNVFPGSSDALDTVDLHEG